jgi:uncharacterized BrkB/YihY/UPF0761 family membrane protein
MKRVRWVFYLPSSLVLGLCLLLFIWVFRYVSSFRVSRLRAGLGVVALLLLLLFGELGLDVAISYEGRSMPMPPGVLEPAGVRTAVL